MRKPYHLHVVADNDYIITQSRTYPTVACNGVLIGARPQARGVQVVNRRSTPLIPGACAYSRGSCERVG